MQGTIADLREGMKTDRWTDTAKSGLYYSRWAFAGDSCSNGEGKKGFQKEVSFMMRPERWMGIG